MLRFPYFFCMNLCIFSMMSQSKLNCHNANAGKTWHAGSTVLTRQIPPVATNSNSPSFYHKNTNMRAYRGLMGSLCAKFNGCMYKRKAIMFQLPFSVINVM